MAVTGLHKSVAHMQGEGDAACMLAPFLQSLSEGFRAVLWTVWENGRKECEVAGELCRVKK